MVLGRVDDCMNRDNSCDMIGVIQTHAGMIGMPELREALAAHMRDYHTPAYDVRSCYAMPFALVFLLLLILSRPHLPTMPTMHNPGLGGGADDGVHGRAHQVLPALQAR